MKKIVKAGIDVNRTRCNILRLALVDAKSAARMMRIVTRFNRVTEQPMEEWKMACVMQFVTGNIPSTMIAGAR